jgi:thioredoxin:protein disulfide reductase
MLTAFGAAVAVLAAASAFAQQPELLEPARAFAFSARALDPQTVEARFTVAKGYYLYREKLKFGVTPEAFAIAGTPKLPAGQVKEDQFFGKVETYRGEVVVYLTLATPAPGSAISLSAESQGCADIGVCYPPQLQTLTVPVPGAGAGAGPLVEAAPAKRSWFR